MKKIVIFILSSFCLHFNLYSQQCSATNTNPPNNAVIYSLTPTLHWNLSYQCTCNFNGFFQTTLRIATDSNMANVIYTYNENNFIISRTVPSGYLQYNTRYWWNVYFYVLGECLGMQCGYPVNCQVTSTRTSFIPSIVGLHLISSNVPDNFSLSQNYPNPFNPTTTIRFAIPSKVKGVTSNLKLIIYDALGREVATLLPAYGRQAGVNKQLQPGTYETEWNATNYPSGVYYYKLVAGDYTETKKMVLVK